MGQVSEVRKDTPFFEGSNPPHDCTRNFSGERKKLRSRDGIVGEDDLNENGGFPLPIGPEYWSNADHLRLKFPRDLGDGLEELGLVRECPGNVHELIIARLLALSQRIAGFAVEVAEHDGHADV